MEILIVYFLIGFLISDTVRIINYTHNVSFHMIFNISIRVLLIILLVIVGIVLH